MPNFKYGPIKAVIAFFAVIVLLPSAMNSASRSVSENLELQKNHMTYLENEFYKDYSECDEQQFADFDIQSAIDSGVKFNEVRFLGTHNSYQIKPTREYTKLYDNLDLMTFGAVKGEKTQFCSDFLTQQFELGIRSIELDIETIDKRGKVSFVVSHEPLLDITSNCYDFRTALREIKMWSDHNPKHLPITIIIEPKKNVPLVNGMKNFSLKYAREFDKMLKEELGETLLTPSDMLRNYPSFADMRRNDDWLTLEKTLGKVLVLLHETSVTTSYMNSDNTMRAQAMFPMLRYSDIGNKNASFILDNDPSSALDHKAQVIENNRLIVRTRADSYLSYSTDKYIKSMRCGSQIISTDYPVKKNEPNDHVFDFGSGATVTLLK